MAREVNSSYTCRILDISFVVTETATALFAFSPDFHDEIDEIGTSTTWPGKWPSLSHPESETAKSGHFHHLAEQVPPQGGCETAKRGHFHHLAGQVAFTQPLPPLAGRAAGSCDRPETATKGL